MSAPGPVYRPRPEQIAALCARLRHEGLIGEGPGDELRLRAALARLPPQPLDRLGHIIVTVCRSGPDRAMLDEALRPWLQSLPPISAGGAAPTPPSAPATPRPPRWRAIAAAAAGLTLAVGLYQIAAEPAVSTGAPPVTAAADDDAGASAAGTTDDLDTTPRVARLEPRGGVTPPDDRPPLQLWSTALALLAALAAARVRWSRPTVRRAATPPEPRGAFGPPALPPMRLATAPRLIPREASQRLGAGSGRAVPDPESRQIDIDATVRATAAQGGRIPIARYRPVQQPEPIELWVDRRAHREPTLVETLTELSGCLERAGVRWRQRALLPDGTLTGAHGERITLDRLPGDPADRRVAVLTDGTTPLRWRGKRRARLVGQLRRYPGLAFIRFGGGPPAAVADHLDRAAPAFDPTGLVPWLLAVRHQRPPPVELAALRRWAALCALAPRPPSEGELFDLRGALAPEIAPSAIDALRADVAQAWAHRAAAPDQPAGDAADLRGPPDRRAALLGWLRRAEPSTWAAGLRWWAHRVEEQPTARALLGLWRPPAVASRAAVALARSGPPAAVDPTAAVAAAVADPLGWMAPADWAPAHPDAIALPWTWGALTADGREALRALGLARALGLDLDLDAQRWPRAARRACGAGLGLAAALLLGAALPSPDPAPAPSVEWARGPVDPRFISLPESATRPAMVAIEPGVFQMGSPADEVGRSGGEGQHEVALTRGFWAAETPVTQGQYGALTGKNPSRFSGSPGDEARPVEQVSWYDAVRYCNALSKAEGLPAAYRVGEGDAPEVEWVDDSTGYRLPTEAEWEYLARAGTATATWAGPLEIVGERNAPALAEVGWYGGNSGSSHPRARDSSDWAEKAEPHTRASTQPVKGKGANPWGLYDVLGNVYEWVWDWHGAYPAGQAVDPAGPPRGVQRVIRGGAFDSYARGLRAADRDRWLPGDRGAFLGLRPVRSAPRAGASVDRP